MNPNPDNSAFSAPPSDGAADPPVVPEGIPPNVEMTGLEAIARDLPNAEESASEIASGPEPSDKQAEPSMPVLRFGGALGWTVLFSIFSGFAAVPCYLLVSLVLPDKTRPVLLFVSSSIATCLIALGLVKKHFGIRSRQRLAIRRIRLLHLVLVVLLAPPLFLLVTETVNRASLSFDLVRKQAGPREYTVGRADLRLALASRLSDFTEQMYREMAAQPWWLILLAGCLLPAVGEEAFCRGFLGRGLVARYGPIVGILLTSLLFGALHIEPVRICATTVMGIALHIVYLTTRTYWAPVVLHALHNSIVFAAHRLGENATLDITGQYEDGHLPPLLVAAAGTAVLALFWLLYRTRTHWVLASGEDWSPGYVSVEVPPAELAACDRLGSAGQVSPWLTVIVYFGFTMVAVVEAEPGTPHTAWSYNERGNQRLAREEYDLAISDYTEAIRLDSEYVFAYGNRGLALLRKQRYAEAIADLDHAIRLDPKLANAYLNRGLAHQGLGHYDLAIADFDRVLRLKPEDTLARYNRGLGFFLKGEDARAIADFTAVLEREPDNADAHLRRGHAYLITREWKDAFRDQTTVIRLEPNCAAAYYLRSFARQSQGDEAGADADLREALRIDPGITEKFK